MTVFFVKHVCMHATKLRCKQEAHFTNTSNYCNGPYDTWNSEGDMQIEFTSLKVIVVVICISFIL